MVFRVAPVMAALGLVLTLITGCGDVSEGITVVPSSNEQDTQPKDDPDTNNPATMACETDSSFMANRAWPRVLSQCAACHNDGGLAGQSAYILNNSLSALDANYAASLSYENAYPGGLLNKASSNGVTHGGGVLLTSGDENFQILTELTQRFTTPITSCDTSDEPPVSSSLDPRTLINKLTMASAAYTYRQAALLMNGRLPSNDELALITDSNLKLNLRSLMSGPEFDDFLMEAANDQLLTMKWAGSRTPGLSALNGEHFYPHINSRIAPLELALENANTDEERQLAQQRVWDTLNKTNLALAQEPLRLIARVVQQEQAYSQVLTANYILVNPYLNDIFNTGLSFVDSFDFEDWQPAQINTGYRNGANLPHAGILTSPMFLARFPSTDTNRNRARSRWTHYFFLGVDIEGLATRPMNSDSLTDVDNPTLNNPDCAVCHELMDPVAGAFQNWGNDGQFRDQCGWFPDNTHPEGGEWLCDQDALPWVGYKEFFDPYVVGDLWYRDMRLVGFGSLPLPDNQENTGLRWLAQQLVEDPRFASGTVKFWFKGVFAREPVPLPTNTMDQQFAGRLGAFDIDRLLIEEFATAFANGSAGTAAHGAFNLKDLLVDMLASPLFRAQSSEQALRLDEQIALNHMGLDRLLTPEQLNRKLTALLGTHWSHVWDENSNQLTSDFYVFYGGIDSDGVTDRNPQLNTLMATVVERYSSEMVCRLVIDDFELPITERLLFSDVGLTDTPATASGQDAIKTAMSHLISRFWGSDEATSSEINAAFDLFVDLRDERLQNNATTVLNTNASHETHDNFDEFCQLDWQNENALRVDSNQVVRPWMGVLMYLISDYKVLYL